MRKYAILGVIALSVLMGCSKSQKEETTKVVEDMTGVTTVKQGQRAIDKVDSITAVDLNRVNSTMSIDGEVSEEE